MSLWRREEEARLPRRMDWGERRRVIEALRRILAGRREVALAVVYGGFVRDEVFRDVDVAVYTAYRVAYDDEPLYTYRLAGVLEEHTRGIPVDVKLLDYAPSWFIVEALTTGVVLVERSPGLLLRILEWARVEEARVRRIRKA